MKVSKIKIENKRAARVQVLNLGKTLARPKHSSTEWTVGKLLALILAVILLVLIIWGWTSGAMTPLKDKFLAFWDSVLAYFGKGGGTGQTYTKAITIPEINAKGNLSINSDTGECKVDLFVDKQVGTAWNGYAPGTYIGSYKIDDKTGDLMSYENFKIIGPVKSDNIDDINMMYIRISASATDEFSPDGKNWMPVTKSNPTFLGGGEYHNWAITPTLVKLLDALGKSNEDNGNAYVDALADIYAQKKVFEKKDWVDVEHEVAGDVQGQQWMRNLRDALNQKKNNLVIGDNYGKTAWLDSWAGVAARVGDSVYAYGRQYDFWKLSGNSWQLYSSIYPGNLDGWAKDMKSALVGASAAQDLSLDGYSFILLLDADPETLKETGGEPILAISDPWGRSNGKDYSYGIDGDGNLYYRNNFFRTSSPSQLQDSYFTNKRSSWKWEKKSDNYIYASEGGWQKMQQNKIIKMNLTNLCA